MKLNSDYMQDTEADGYTQPEICSLCFGVFLTPEALADHVAYFHLVK